MNRLSELFNHRFTGYFLEAAKFFLLLGAVLHVGDRIYVLETGGCECYYSEFSGVEDFNNKKFFNRTERKELLKPSTESESFNDSVRKRVGVNENYSLEAGDYGVDNRR